ncbi:MAG: PTS sugar transporter subunit IIA [Eubacteriaceae bacterium]
MENEVGMLKEELIYIGLEAENNLEALKTMGNDFVKYGYGRESFPEAVVAREKTFATGIPTETIGVAIPHADPIHVNGKALGLAVLKKPIDFVVLGDDSEKVPVEIIFMIATNEADGHLVTLQKLTTIFENAEILQRIKNAKEPKEILGIFSKI